LITQAIVIALFFLNRFDYINLPYLWLNFVGCVIVIFIALLLSFNSANRKDKLSLAILSGLLGFVTYTII